MKAINFVDVWPNIYLFDLLRYLIPVSLAFLIFWVIAKNGLKHLFIQRSFPESKQLWREICLLDEYGSYLFYGGVLHSIQQREGWDHTHLLQNR